MFRSVSHFTDCNVSAKVIDVLLIVMRTQPDVIKTIRAEVTLPR